MKTAPPRAKTFTAYVEWDAESRLYVGSVPGIRGAHTQAPTLDELRENLQEVLKLVFEEESPETPQFVGIQQVEIDV